MVSYVQLTDKIAIKKAIINSKNQNDNECFIVCVSRITS